MLLPRPALALFYATAVVAAHPVRAAEPEFASQVSHLEIRQMKTIPANPSPGGSDAFCPVLLDTPETAAGRQLAQSGWLVSGEIKINGLTLVSFVGVAEQGTSGSCLLSQGNVAVFDDTTLRGLIYAPAGAERDIGSIEAMEAGRIRIWDGDYLAQPLADIQIIGDDLVILSDVASRDSFCDGAASVPSLYRLPIHLARRVLLAEGWLPEEALDEAAMGWTAEMRNQWPELQDCSGTGFGFCAWSYIKGPGQRLSVTTAGEAPEGSSPAVIGYGVSCDG